MSDQSGDDPTVAVVGGLQTTRYGSGAHPVVFLHGLFGQGRNWTAIAKALLPEHASVLVDLPDHGASVWTERFDYLAIADRVADALRADGPVDLVGHSMGGKVAMVLALRHPHLVRRLVVVDISPAAQSSTGEFRRYITGMRAMDLAAIQRRSDAHDQLRGAAPDDTIRAFLLQNLRHDDGQWRWQVNLDMLDRDLAALGEWPDDRLGAAVYDGPVLWLKGERSPYVHDDYHDAMLARFPATRRVTIKDAGHWLHSEQPAVFVEVMRHFLRD